MEALLSMGQSWELYCHPTYINKKINQNIIIAFSDLSFSVSRQLELKKEHVNVWITEMMLLRKISLGCECRCSCLNLADKAFSLLTYEECSLLIYD